MHKFHQGDKVSIQIPWFSFFTLREGDAQKEVTCLPQNKPSLERWAAHYSRVVVYKSEQCDRIYFSPSLLHHTCIPGIRRTTLIKNILRDQASTTSQKVTGLWNTKTGAVVLFPPFLHPLFKHCSIQLYFQTCLGSYSTWAEHLEPTYGTQTSPHDLSLAQSCPLPWRPALTRESCRGEQQNPKHQQNKSPFQSQICLCFRGKAIKLKHCSPYARNNTLFIQLNFL